MYESPAPTHGYLGVIAAFWLYLALAAAVAVGAWKFGVSTRGTFFIFLLAALVLLKPFLPLFRRLLPTASHEK